MSKKEDDDREKNINREVDRLTKIYYNIDKKKRLLSKGLISRAAFLRVSMEYLEDDINKNGYVEMFAQGDQDPYERKRPSVEIYNSMNALYQKIIKQMTDMLPKEVEKVSLSDEFDDFVFKRDD